MFDRVTEAVRVLLGMGASTPAAAADLVTAPVEEAVDTSPAPEARAENPSSLSDPASWLFDVMGVTRSLTGVAVNERVALENPVFLAGTSIICDAFAMTPIKVIEEKAGGKEVEVKDHPASYILRSEANEMMDAHTWKETACLHYLLYNCSFSQIQLNRFGEPLALWPLAKRDVKPEMEGRVLQYRVAGEDKPFSLQEILHLRTLSLNGVDTWSRIQLAAETLGQSISSRHHASSWFKNSAVPAGWIEAVGGMDDDRAKALSERLSLMHGGNDGRHGWAVMPPGHKLHPMGIDPEKMQLIETRKHLGEEQARTLRVQPHLAGIMDKATFSNIEEQNLEFVQFTMMPVYSKFGSQMTLRMTTRDERRRFGLKIKFVFEALMRGRQRDRMEAYKIPLDRGAMSIEEFREKEDLGPKDPDHTFIEQTNTRAVKGDGTVLRDAAKGDNQEPEPEPETDPAPDSGEEDRSNILPITGGRS